jgi:hypothetical protein
VNTLAACKILALDPGKTTGWACITVTDKIIHLGQFGNCKDMELVELVPYIEDADVVVYESFYVRPDMAMSGKFNWSEMPALKVIGSLMTLCKLHQKSTVVKQQPSQRVPGYAFAGMNYKQKAKGKHWQDALAHACFYAVKNLHAFPVGVSVNASEK